MLRAVYRMRLCWRRVPQSRRRGWLCDGLGERRAGWEAVRSGLDGTVHMCLDNRFVAIAIKWSLSPLRTQNGQRKDYVSDLGIKITTNWYRSSDRLDIGSLASKHSFN